MELLPNNQVSHTRTRCGVADLFAEEALAKTSLNENNTDEWGEFLHLPGQKFHDFHKIRDEIVKDTEKMTGKNAGE